MLTARDSSPQRPQTFSSCVLQNKQVEFPCLLCRRYCPIRWNTAHPIPVFPYGSLSFLHSLVASARFPGPNSAPQGTFPILSGQLLFSVKLLPSYKESYLVNFYFLLSCYLLIKCHCVTGLFSFSVIYLCPSNPARWQWSHFFHISLCRARSYGEGRGNGDGGSGGRGVSE